MDDLLTTLQAAVIIADENDAPVKEWHVRRLFTVGDLPEPPKFGGKRVIQRSLLPVIADALRARGWLPAPHLEEVSA